MKKATMGLVLFVALVSGLAATNSSFHFEIGAFYGTRQTVDSDIKSVYGNGMIYFPFLALTWKGVILGAGYEGGYSKTGKIGIYQEASRLTVNGFELYIGYAAKISRFFPYIKIGYGSYSYKQTIDSPYISDVRVDGSKSTVTGSGGIKFYPIKNIFLAIEVRYVPLKVKPLEEEVDLSGMRFQGGVGFSI